MGTVTPSHIVRDSVSVIGGYAQGRDLTQFTRRVRGFLKMVMLGSSMIVSIAGFLTKLLSLRGKK